MRSAGDTTRRTTRLMRGAERAMEIGCMHFPLVSTFLLALVWRSWRTHNLKQLHQFPSFARRRCGWRDGPSDAMESGERVSNVSWGKWFAKLLIFERRAQWNRDAGNYRRMQIQIKWRIKIRLAIMLKGYMTFRASARETEGAGESENGQRQNFISKRG